MNIYEVHLGSWKQQEHPEDPDYPFLTYRQLADDLIPYARKWAIPIWSCFR